MSGPTDWPEGSDRDRRLEPRKVAEMRKRHGPQFDLAERVLTAATRMGLDEHPRHASGDAAVPKVLLAIYGKMVYVYWGLIVLAERSLPTSALIRELMESFVSLAYITNGETVERARLFRDSVALQASRHLQKRLKDEDSRESVRPSDLAFAEELARRVRESRTTDEIDAMMKWRTWSGLSVEAMLRAAGLSTFLYRGPYAAESESLHGFDAFGYFNWLEGGGLELVPRDLVNLHLIPAATLLVSAMILLHDHLGFNRREDTVRLFEAVLAFNRLRARGETEE